MNIAYNVCAPAHSCGIVRKCDELMEFAIEIIYLMFLKDYLSDLLLWRNV